MCMNRRPLPRKLAALLILSATSAAQMRTALSQSALIQDVTLISPERASPMPYADVLLENGKIVKIGRKLVAGLNVQRIDGSGRFLIPGLIDSHVHAGHSAALDDDAIEAREPTCCYSKTIRSLAFQRKTL